LTPRLVPGLGFLWLVGAVVRMASPWLAAALAALVALPSDPALSQPMRRSDGLLLGIFLLLAIIAARHARDEA
jgi:hypothetical protein